MSPSGEVGLEYSGKGNVIQVQLQRCWLQDESHLVEPIQYKKNWALEFPGGSGG